MADILILSRADRDRHKQHAVGSIKNILRRPSGFLIIKFQFQSEPTLNVHSQLPATNHRKMHSQLPRFKCLSHDAEVGITLKSIILSLEIEGVAIFTSNDRIQIVINKKLTSTEHLFTTFLKGSRHLDSTRYTQKLTSGISTFGE